MGGASGFISFQQSLFSVCYGAHSMVVEANEENSWGLYQIKKNENFKKFKVKELAEGVFIADNVFTQKECKRLAEAAVPFLISTNPKNDPPEKGYAFRNNERFLIHDTAFAEKLWKQKLRRISARGTRDRVMVVVEGVVSLMMTMTWNKSFKWTASRL